METTGPTGPAPAPPPATAPADKPAGLDSDCQASIPAEPYGRFDLVVGNSWMWVTRGVCPVTVDEESHTVEFILPPKADETAVRTSLSYSGTGTLDTYFGANDRFARLNVTLPPGPAGEQADLRLTGPLGPDGAHVDMVFRLTRVPSARIESEVQVGGGPWEPLAGVRVVPAESLSLRLKLLNGVDPADVRRVLERALGKTDFRLDEPTPGVIVTTIPQPPPVIEFDIWRLRGPHGSVQGDSFTLYPGGPPTLVALDPATGLERSIGTAPPDVWTGSLSPDGLWALLAAVEPEDCYESRVWLMDLSTGRAEEIPLDHSSFFTPVAWPDGRLVTAFNDTVQVYHLADGTVETRTVAPRFWAEPSPDGRHLLGYIKHYDRERPDWNAPITLLVYDLETGQERTFPDVAWVKVTHSGAPPLTRLFWTADGRGILINDPRGDDPQVGGTSVLHLNPETGASTPYSLPAPDLSDWKPGPSDSTFRPHGWPKAGWGPVTVRSPGGEERQFGEGLILGWAPDGNLLLLRWAQGGGRHCEGE